MGYKVHFPSASIEKKFEKALEEVFPSPLRLQIASEMEKLADIPRPYGNPKLKPPIHVYSYIAQYRLRVGNYRILYDVDDSRKIVWILDLRKRSERTYL